MTPLDPEIARRLEDARGRFLADGALPTRPQIEEQLGRFRARFSIERLRALDGEALLETMFRHGNKDGLVYWLEFKDDDEFTNHLFGGIAGANAFKYGLYRRQEDGGWTAGFHPTKRIDVSIPEAIDRARAYRAQLEKAAALLAGLPATAGDAEYERLQTEIDGVAPDLSDTAWGHKYLALLFADKLDTFHVRDYQNWHCIQLLQLPPSSKGRFVSAGRFVAVAKHLDLHMVQATRLLNLHHGYPAQAWVVDSDRTGPRKADALIRHGVVAFAGAPREDIAAFLKDRPRQELRVRIAEEEPGLDPQELARRTTELARFAREANLGDHVLIADGPDVVAVGVIEGEYAFDTGLLWPHTRAVQWVSVERWRLKSPKSPGATFDRLDELVNRQELRWRMLHPKEPQKGVRAPMPRSAAPEVAPIEAVPGREAGAGEGNPATEAARQDSTGTKAAAAPPSGGPDSGEGQSPRGAGVAGAAGGAEPSRARPAKFPVRDFTGLAGRIQGVLKRKSQVILFGPPGTGKTYWAERTAQDIAAGEEHGTSFDELTPVQREALRGPQGRVRIVSFHPTFGYEDFIEGYRPQSRGGAMHFEPRDGIMKRICADAAAEPERSFFLVIDEINRGDVPRIFGELLTVLEPDKRGRAVLLPLSQTHFAVPSNVFVIGTMNTADRSVALLDAALRRRFGFVELMPDTVVLNDAVVGGLPIGRWLRGLNERICEHVKRDSRNLQVGHAYFFDRGAPVSEPARLVKVLSEDIVPLLQEYCYGDYATLAKVLGSGLVDVQKQRVREDLFEPGRAFDLVKALVGADPELVTTRQATIGAAAADEASEMEEAEDRDAAAGAAGAASVVGGSRAS